MANKYAYKNFAFDVKDYTPEAFENEMHTVAEYRQEYARLYEVTRVRTRRLRDKGLTDTKTYKYAKENIKPPSQVSDKDLGKALQQQYKFLTSKTSTIRGMNEVNQNVLNGLAQAGIYFVNAENLKDFGNFMEEARALGLDKIYGSLKVADMYNYKNQKKISKDELFKNFKDYVEKQTAEYEKAMVDKQKEVDS